MANIAGPIIRAASKAAGPISKVGAKVKNGFFDPLARRMQLAPGARFKTQSLADLSTKTKAGTSGTLVGALGTAFNLSGDDNTEDADAQVALQNLLNNPEATNDPNISSLIRRAINLNSPNSINESDEETFSPPTYEELDEGGFGAVLDGLSKANPDGSGVAGGTHLAQFLQQVANQGDENSKANYENARKVFEDTLALRQVISQEENVALQSQISQGNLLLGAAQIEAGRERDQVSNKGDNDKALVGRLLGIAPDELVAEFQGLYQTDPDVATAFFLQAMRELANAPPDPNKQAFEGGLIKDANAEPLATPKQ